MKSITLFHHALQYADAVQYTDRKCEMLNTVDLFYIH